MVSFNQTEEVIDQQIAESVTYLLRPNLPALNHGLGGISMLSFESLKNTADFLSDKIGVAVDKLDSRTTSSRNTLLTGLGIVTAALAMGSAINNPESAQAIIDGPDTPDDSCGKYAPPVDVKSVKLKKNSAGKKGLVTWDLLSINNLCVDKGMRSETLSVVSKGAIPGHPFNFAKNWRETPPVIQVSQENGNEARKTTTTAFTLPVGCNNGRAAVLVAVRGEKRFLYFDGRPEPLTIFPQDTRPSRVWKINCKTGSVSLTNGRNFNPTFTRERVRTSTKAAKAKATSSPK